jgi:hypothetical protein
MRRTSRKLSIVAVTSGLVACWHEPFRTSLENETGERIYTVIRFEDPAIPIGRGYIDAGNGLDLPQKVKAIASIEYETSHGTCQLNKKAITALSQGKADGFSTIVLKRCR